MPVDSKLEYPNRYTRKARFIMPTPEQKRNQIVRDIVNEHMEKMITEIAEKFEVDRDGHTTLQHDLECVGRTVEEAFRNTLKDICFVSRYKT